MSAHPEPAPSDLSDSSAKTLTPASLAELTEAILSTDHLIAVGGGTKPRLSQCPGAVRLSTRALTGITEYDPSEFTFTALAGTPLREIVAALAERGQYLPFDPMLVAAGATLGGTVAAGLSGPGRFRYGGIRDFILGIRFADGLGRLLRMGGKVVKNAAGFDLPKFFVGSLGRFGVLAEITFKVFPRPPAALTLRLDASTPEALVKVFTEAASSRFEFDALDAAPGQPGILARIAGPATALEPLAEEILARWPGEILAIDAAAQTWRDLREFQWPHSGTPLVKVATSPAALLPLFSQMPPQPRCHISVGGNALYLSLDNGAHPAALDQLLQSVGSPGLTLRGPAPLFLGARQAPAIASSVKKALDRNNRFPALS